MSHLGRRLSALIDGELGDAERDQAHAHLVSCEACRAEAAALRTLKRRVHGLGEAPADSALTRRLIALEGLSEAAPPHSRMPGAARARAALSAFSGAGPGARPGWDGFPAPLTPSPLTPSPLAVGAGAPAISPLAASRGRLHTRYLVAGAVAALAVGLSAASFAVGGAEQHMPGPMITPEVDSFNIQHAATFGQLPAFPTPTAIPVQQRPVQQSPVQQSPVQQSPVRQTVGLPKP